MKIGINTLWVVPGEVGGAEYYLTNLLNGFHRTDSVNTYVLFTTPMNEGLYGFPSENFKKVILPFSNRHRRLRVLYEQLVLPYLTRREGLDILHAPDNISAPLIKTCGSVLTIQYLHCFLFRRELPRAKMAYIRNHLRISVRMADHVITPSQSTRDDAIRIFRLPRDRITSVLDYVSTPTLFPDGIQPDAGVLKKYGINRPYLFSPSSMYPYKNIAGMLRILRELRAQYQVQVSLVVAGRDYISYYPKTRRLAEELGVGDTFHYLGAVPHEEMPSLYHYADLTLFLSYCETFGIPLIESMAVGTPVVCSNRSSLPEVAGDAAVLVDPDDAEEMSRAVYDLIMNQDMRRDLKSKGLERCRHFSCEKAAKQTLHIYKEVCGHRGLKRDQSQRSVGDQSVD